MQQAPIPDADAAPDIELLVREDKLKLLFQQSFPALFISYATALLLAWMLWDHASNVAIVVWLGVLAFGAMSRLVLFLGYFRIEPRGVRLLKLERPYGVSLIVSSLIWGVGALIVMPADSLLYQALTLFILIGMAGGAVSVYSARYLMAIGSMASVLLPATLWLYTQPGKEQFGMAIGASMFMVVLLRAAKVLANALQRNFQLSRELRGAHAAADRQAKTDPLTGINNRRAFLDHGEHIIRYCERHDLTLAVLAMDIDHFKSINDTFGHFAGDSQKYRDPQEIEGVRKFDPILRFRNFLLGMKALTEAEVEKFEAGIKAEIDEAVAFAEKSPVPGREELGQDVYA